jgi:hypothetical protein
MSRWRIRIAFVVGLGLGIAGTILGSRLAGPYLPQALRGKTERIQGTVARKQREPDRLLLTVVSDHGAILATFRKKIAEINLLVEQGDSLTLLLPGYGPFVDDPPIERVRKENAAGPAGVGGPVMAPAEAAPEDRAPGQ